MRFERIVCREAVTADPLLEATGKLYERVLDPDERIPWEWIERSVGRPPGTKPGWARHLLLATVEGRPDEVAGFAYGAFLAGYGGYLCYVGVDERFRGLGVGTRLMADFAAAMAADARAAGEPLPFVVWESHRPGRSATAAERELWAARVRLFDKAGGLWVKGLNFLSPNFDREDGPPVPLQLFVQPVDVVASDFDPARVEAVVRGLHERVYRQRPGDPLFDGTMKPARGWRLVPARKAAGSPRPKPLVPV